MPKLYSFTHLSDGQRIFLAESHPVSSTRDDSGYQYFDAFEDEYMENKIGCLGISVSGTVAAMWAFGEENDARSNLAKVMRLAFPLMTLPLTPEKYSSIPSGYFPVVTLFSDGTVYYDEKNQVIHVPSTARPEDFFKEIIFDGKLDDDNVRRLVLLHGYLEGLTDEYGDFRFFSADLTDRLWPINPARVTKAFRVLVEDGHLEILGARALSGFPSFTRVTTIARRIIEDSGTQQADTKPETVDTENLPIDVAPYLSPEISRQLIDKARSRGYNTSKLEAIVSELNDAAARNNAQSSHALTRALLDHIAPLFGCQNFIAVANNHPWSHTDKKRIQMLNTLFRFDADDSLHTPISKKDTSVDMHSIGLIRRTVNVILEEAAEQK